MVWYGKQKQPESKLANRKAPSLNMTANRTKAHSITGIENEPHAEPCRSVAVRDPLFDVARTLLVATLCAVLALATWGCSASSTSQGSGTEQQAASQTAAFEDGSPVSDDVSGKEAKFGQGDTSSTSMGSDASADKSKTPSASEGSASSTGVSNSSSASESDTSSTEEGEASSSGENANDSNRSPANAQPTYPTGWLAVSIADIPAGEPVSILYLPDIDVHAHIDGADVSTDVQKHLSAELPQASEGCALVEYDGRIEEAWADALLVNLPDIMPQASYDIVYAYASTSRCGAYDIPGVTGQQIDGYENVARFSPYWRDARFAVPCAYRTALKAISACEALAARGFRLVVYDAYRPMRAQYYLSDALMNACAQNPALADELGWGMEWYVASGPSGHNFGTDLDVGACSLAGEPVVLPSAFDAFDESGHLCSWPMSPSEITPESYSPAVQQSDACLALHEAFTQAGFSELASEWWHFGDDETEWAMRSLVGGAGLDFASAVEGAAIG